MEDTELAPRLRVMPIAAEAGGRRVLIFQDQERISEQTVMMPFEAAAIIQFLDGTRSIRQIQEELTRQTGEFIDSDLIKQVIQELDQHLLLESPGFYSHVTKLYEEWANTKVRPPYHAGQAYPADKEELTSFLDKFYADPQGPGEAPAGPRGNSLKGIVAPHMSIKDSGAATTHAFKKLAEGTEAELFVIFGTGHMEEQRMFVLSDKDFQTPLGTAPADKDLVHRVARLQKNRNPINDYLHKQEHSIEFMVVFLQHALAEREIRILPVLCSGTGPSIISMTPPAKDPAFKDFMQALRKAISERGEQVCFIASADLAHLGPRYGDQERYTPIRMPEEEESDMKMIEPLLSGDGDGFFNVIAGHKDKRKICGLPPVYAAMKASAAEKARLLKWSFWHEEATHSVVTFASMALY